MLDYSKYVKAGANPDASSMIETFRAVGYNIQTALADIIDNSISAEAKHIWIDFFWKGEESVLQIKDDGKGMDSKEIIQALRPGSKNPNSKRAINDLGRFGLGLKTASFSQCKQLTVVSKKVKCTPAFWMWDLDYVNETGEWKVIRFLNDADVLKQVAKQKSGTIVIWNQIDRLVSNLEENNKKDLEKILIVLEQVKSHLAMVFHRFIEEKKIKIYFQGRSIEPWNPFLKSHKSTQEFPKEPLSGAKVKVKGYVLPHKSKLSNEEFRNASGPNGWNEQQGFYIYRNDRLLVAGDWLGMFKKEEHYKLARIEVNLPNSLDAEWQIDIKKSVARPPLLLRDQLKAYAAPVRAQAVEVYRHKARYLKPLPGQEFVPLWIESKRGNKWFHKINREHPLLQSANEIATKDVSKVFERLLRFIEETIPAKSIYIKEAEDPELEGKPFEGAGQEPIKQAMQEMYTNLMVRGRTDAQAKSLILNIEPFNHFSHFLESLT